MIVDYYKDTICKYMGYAPTTEQDIAMRRFLEFMHDRNERVAMILCGSAGTGKTTLAGAIVKALREMKQKIVLMAPTGRAAKVFALNAGQAAFTIHRKIYRQKTMTDMASPFTLNVNLATDTLFIIDEASMIANMGDSTFGSGCLLDDLVQYVYSGRNCRMLLIGDTAQLPPVGEDESPALQKMMIEGYGLDVYEATLSEVLRQSHDSGILYNATEVRLMIEREDMAELPKVRFSGFDDIVNLRGDELIEQLATSYSEMGLDDTIVVTRSNKRANIYNNGIRNMVLGREELISQGDMLMVVKNNYYWAETLKLPLPFIANGDRARVMRVRNMRELYGFHFADLTLSLPDYDGLEMTVTTMLDSLQSESPSLTREQNEQLFQQVMADYQHLPYKADRYKALRQDPYFNALQVKYAYAVTCHKAQGGQWAHVYVDQGYMTDDMLSPDYLHWLYTAFTRATEKLYLVNWPKEGKYDNIH